MFVVYTKATRYRTVPPETVCDNTGVVTLTTISYGAPQTEVTGLYTTYWTTPTIAYWYVPHCPTAYASRGRTIVNTVFAGKPSWLLLATGLRLPNAGLVAVGMASKPSHRFSIPLRRNFRYIFLSLSVKSFSDCRLAFYFSLWLSFTSSLKHYRRLQIRRERKEKNTEENQGKFEESQRMAGVGLSTLIPTHGRRQH